MDRGPNDDGGLFEGVQQIVEMYGILGIDISWERYLGQDIDWNLVFGAVKEW